jgi:hypothetical protein
MDEGQAAIQPRLLLLAPWRSNIAFEVKEHKELLVGDAKEDGTA